MPRGVVLSLTPAEVVARARSLCVVPSDPAARIYYSSKPGRNGGADPEAITCASLWRDKTDTQKDARGRLWATADCVGFGLWCYGMDRYQPPLWLNQNSLYRAARDKQGWRFLGAAGDEGTMPYPGCLALIIDELVNGKKRVGHVGVITDEVAETAENPEGWLVAHCSPSNHKRAGQGIAETTLGQAFGKRRVYCVERVS